MRRPGVRVEPLPWNVQRPDERRSEPPLSRGARDRDGDVDATLVFLQAWRIREFYSAKRL